MRYGLLGVSGKPDYDRVSNMIERLKKYQKDHNKEHLLDIANIAEIEFVEGKGHFKATDDGEHCGVKT
jgi:hypothetical protein